MSYALQTLWHERSRYFSGVFAVAFSAILIALQCGLLLGLFKITSVPLDHAIGNTPADLWVGSKGVPSFDLGRPIPVSHLTRLAGTPGVRMPELVIANFANFQKPGGGTELCFLVGVNLDDDSLGVSDVLTPQLREELTLPGTIVVDESDLKRLTLDVTGGGRSKPKINNREVRLVGTTTGIRALAAPWIYCSQHTARELMGFMLPREHCTYMIARCDSPERASELVTELRTKYEDDMNVYTATEFSTGTRMYWLLRTKAGVAIGYAAFLGLIVGSVITSQTLYSATMASAKEFAILLALGIPRRHVYLMVLAQSFWVGVIGVLFAYPACLGLRYLAMQANADVDLRWEILAGTAVITLVMAVGSGLVALRSVRQIEPMTLLR